MMDTASPPGAHGLGFKEFVVLVAAMMVCQAVAIDTMLPALPTIARTLGVIDANRAQWIVYAYVAGLGCGQLVWGMVSDRFGRRRVLLFGLALYALAAVMCSLSGSFTALLWWRFAHGIAAATIVIARSVIRDLYSGATMARIMSLTFIVFLISPVVAPSVGQLILLLLPWHFLFIAMAAVAAGVWLWVLLRLPETLHPQYRLRFDRARVAHAWRLVLGHRIAMGYTLASGFVMGTLLSYLGMVEQIFTSVFHHARLMPTMFALSAGAMGAASFLNSRIVEQLGMRRISHSGLLVLAGVSLLHTLLALTWREPLALFVVMQSLSLACVGLTVANFGTLALEPMATVAGVAASLQGFISSLCGAACALLVGLQFAGSVMPLALGSGVCALVAIGCVLWGERWRLFHGALRSGTAARLSASEPF